jgi:hypothetical protein
MTWRANEIAVGKARDPRETVRVTDAVLACMGG